MPTIHTLVQDIYEWLEDDKKKIDPTTLESFSKELAAIVAEKIDSHKSGPEPLRLSSIGQPNRKLYYMAKDYPKEKLDGRARLQFLIGDIYEAVLLFIIKQTDHEVTEEQKEVEVEGVKGHKDCRIDGTLVDIKSCSPYGFNKFINGDVFKNDPFGYIPQISAYAVGDGDEEAAFLAAQKVNGSLHVTPVHKMEMINATDRVKEVKEVVAGDALPPRCYDPVPDGSSGNMVLDLGCRYCPFKRECWKDANNGQGLRVFDYAQGPKYFTFVQKEPRVEEVTTEYFKETKE